MDTTQKYVNQKPNGIPTSEKEIPKTLLKKEKASKSIESIRNSKFKNGFDFDKMAQKTNKEANSNNKDEKILHSEKAESRSLSPKKRNDFHHTQFNSKTNKDKKTKPRIEDNIQGDEKQEEKKNSINTLDFSSKSPQVEIKNNINTNSLKKKETNVSNAEIEKEDDIGEINSFKTENEKILNNINNILTKEIPDINLLLDNLKILLKDYPAINEFNQVKDPLFSTDDFDIFKNSLDNNLLFSINLSNIISVMNLLWEVSNKSHTIFLEYINKLKIYFSYVTDENSSGNDIVMLAPVSENLYNYLSTYGGEMFKDETISKKAFTYVHSFTKFNFDKGYYFEDMNSINLLNYIGDNNYMLLPKVTYYIKENTAKKLNELNIISISDDFKFHDPTKDVKEYKGYNEIDLAIKIKKDVCIQTNENFKLIPKNEYLIFKPANKDNSDEPKKISIPIELKEGEYYLFEMKIKPDSIMNSIDDIRKKYNRYIDALKNTQTIQNFKFEEGKFNLVFICNNSYDDAALATSKKKVKEDVIYSNPQVGLSILLKYDKKFKYLNQKIDSIKNDNERLKAANIKEKEEFNKKLNELKEEFNQKSNEINSLKNSINVTQLKELKEEFDKQNNALKNRINNMELKYEISQYNISKHYLKIISNPMKVIFLVRTKSSREETIQRYGSLYDCFENVSTYFKPIKERENDLCVKIIKYIGKDIKEDKEKEEWRAIKTEILKKYGNSVYYKGLVLFLFGEDYNNKEKEDFSILSGNNSEIRKYVKNFIIFLSIFMDNSHDEDIENKFQSVIVYIAEKMIGMKIINELFDKAGKIIGPIKDQNKDDKIVKSLMQDIISSFNSKNQKRLLDSYSVQK